MSGGRGWRALAVGVAVCALAVWVLSGTRAGLLLRHGLGLRLVRLATVSSNLGYRDRARRYTQ